ncbi:ibr domain protein [Ichthyophthirius multifiliis]|uniref:Ibr domain protein n=1 Tax=Ichthyophthirius multifiliis TaxID=5932 RepID=G0R094_ICHMU|nr:ibr domain protein [Ichthyophthirius multifiliis]EGR29102.1 ibr domain protein [Ichthyophthirius multifiliis]|eukprot:XP_004030338.1 ibr domain protein [Ichthyophthirius multifiliis]
MKTQVDYISKDIYIQGYPQEVGIAKNALIAFLEQNTQNKQLLYTYEECQICANTICNGYRLVICGHQFCFNCLVFIFDQSLGDVNSFPIKCPSCQEDLCIEDLLQIINEDEQRLQKLKRMSINNYVQNHFTELQFCPNELCKAVHSTKLQKYTCYECQKTYCSKCAAEYHFDMTCTQYQETEAQNIQYLIKEGARKCTNCGVFIIRIDGCYRVECKRCQMHICWKDNCMKFFKDANSCYVHLDENHQGYW